MFRQLFIIIIFLFSPFFSRAAILYLEPSSGEYRQGDTFVLDARIDAQEECINAVRANLIFSNDTLEIKDFSRGNSIITIWLEEAEISNEKGTFSFAGGIPGGYCGRLPGDPGESNLLGRIVFRVKEASGGQKKEIKFLENSQVLLNDGLGTPAEFTTKGATIITGAEFLQIPQDEWQRELEEDKTPPELFSVEINRDPSIFEGKYFIIFSTTDKQTGIDHYEVKEGKKDWKTAESPYLLEDQSLRSIIKVGAADKAGNEIIVEYLPPAEKSPFPYWIITLVPAAMGFVWWTIRKLKIEKEK